MNDDQVLKDWFCREVLPLERALTQYIRRHWKVADDVTDLRQDIYEKAIGGARAGVPDNSRAYLYMIARNHLATRARRDKVVSFELIADLESFERAPDFEATDRHLSARDMLRRTQAGLDNLPARCHEVVRLRKVEGLSIKETADRLGISVDTVDVQTRLGLSAITDFVLGGAGKLVQVKSARRNKAERS